MILQLLSKMIKQFIKYRCDFYNRESVRISYLCQFFLYTVTRRVVQVFDEMFDSFKLDRPWRVTDKVPLSPTDFGKYIQIDDFFKTY